MGHARERVTVIDGVCFAESPRWHDGELWFSDMHGHEVLATDTRGSRRHVLDLPAQPSGLGFRPDGMLLVVSMVDRQLLVTTPGKVVDRIDLSPYAAFHCNDMAVDAQGRAYVGGFGYNIYQHEPPRPAGLLRVDLDGSVHVVDDGAYFPNGLALSQDGRRLVAAETFLSRLTTWDVAADGRLSGRRVFAGLGERMPDGICMDAEGAVWAACIEAREVVRVREGGEITDSVSTADLNAYACVLGGDDRRTLFICAAKTGGAASRELRAGRIEAVRVDVPGAGTP